MDYSSLGEREKISLIMALEAKLIDELVDARKMDRELAETTVGDFITQNS